LRAKKKRLTQQTTTVPVKKQIEEVQNCEDGLSPKVVFRKRNKKNDEEDSD
jgi:hypothetical protein